MKSKYIIFNVSGGIGKNIMSTAVIRAIGEEYPDRKIIVTTGYPEVFLGNTYIYRCFKIGFTQYFYDEYIKDKDVIFMADEPYTSNGYLQKDRHLTQAWCELLNVPYKGPEPSLFLNPKEIGDMARTLTKEPFVLFQPFGGANPDIPYSWNRDIPIHQAEEIVEKLSKNYKIMQVCNDKQPKIKGCEHYIAPNLRTLFTIIGLAPNIIAIDSVVQHAAAAVENSENTTVCWITNTPKVFGYETHRNVYSTLDLNESQNSNIEAVFEAYDFTGKSALAYPYNTADVFDVDAIVRPYLEKA